MRIPALALILGLLMASAVVAGCGQKGPLYIPEDPDAVQMEDDAGQDEDETGTGSGY